MGKECLKHVEFLDLKNLEKKPKYCDIKLDTYTLGVRVHSLVPQILDPKN
jgi:hypothetical protein